MSYKPKIHNGIRRHRVRRARYRILKEAKRRGFITNAKARQIGKWDQAWFHLNEMVKAGVLEKGGYNRWLLRKRDRPGRWPLELGL